MNITFVNNDFLSTFVPKTKYTKIYNLTPSSQTSSNYSLCFILKFPVGGWLLKF